MDEQKIGEELESIRKNMKIFDDIVHIESDRENGGLQYSLTEKQKDIVQELLDFFQSLNWQVALNSYRELELDQRGGYKNVGCGTPVKVRSCKEEHGDKTYFGILIGNISLMLHSTIDNDGNLKVNNSMYNPAIFIPELNEVIFGCGSWWGPIKDESELDKLITDESIQNIWYVKMLKGGARNGVISKLDYLR